MRGEVELDTWSKWVKSIRYLILRPIHKLKFCVNQLKDKLANHCLSSFYDKYVVPVDIASNNIVFACKSYYHECLLKEFGISKNNLTVWKYIHVITSIKCRY